MQDYWFYIVIISEIIPLIFCMLFYKKLNTKALKAFFIYTIVLFFFTLLSVFAIKVLAHRETYFFELRLFNICEFTTIAIFTYHIIRNQTIRKLIYFSIPCIIIFA